MYSTLVTMQNQSVNHHQKLQIVLCKNKLLSKRINSTISQCDSQLMNVINETATRQYGFSLAALLLVIC